MLKNIKRIVMLNCIGMFFVLIGGAIVTKTESGKGCGDDWPLCNGKFIPAYTLESMIEYSHRFVSGFVGLIVLFTTIVIFMKLKHRLDAKIYAASGLFFTIVQAIMGMLVVKVEQPSGVLALHFGISLLAFASTMLLVQAVYAEAKAQKISTLGARVKKDYVSRREEVRKEVQQIHGGGISTLSRNLIWFTTIYSYVVIYLGAYVRHSNSAGGCSGWPLCNGKWIPELNSAAGIVFIHRLAALVFFILIICIVFSVRRLHAHPDIQKTARWSLYLSALQIISGAVVTLTMMTEDLYLFTSLFHALIIAFLFGLLCYLSIQVWRVNRLNKLKP